MASTMCSFDASIGLSSINFSAFTNHKCYQPISFLSFPHSSKPPNLVLKPSRLRDCQSRITSKQFLGVPILSCLVGDNAGVYPQSGESSSSSNSPNMGKNRSNLKKRKSITEEDHGGFFDIDGLCNICESKFGNHQAMIQHQWEKHWDYTVFCTHTKCRRRFKDHDSMKDHKERRHAD